MMEKTKRLMVCAENMEAILKRLNSIWLYADAVANIFTDWILSVAVAFDRRWKWSEKWT